ncbi:MAG: transglutaminase family protein [Comamonadaceae bacterium]|nr:MAG: transglutaminase family protein [Comamonadaceae bacterium]
MVRLQFAIELNYDVGPHGSDFIFNMQAAHTRRQTVVTEKLDISQAVVPDMHIDPVSRNRYLRLHAFAGALKVAYSATVDIDHYVMDPAQIGEVGIDKLPLAVLPYIYPSRYCQSDRLHTFAVREFGQIWQGYSRVQAIRDWVANHVVFTSNSTNGNTSALDTIVEQVGVCRDFAHLMIALCRAVNIPARFATGIDYGADPALGPQDFHAYVEVFLGNHWYLFDPSGTAIPMGFVRLATGRDAADAAFATIFGGVNADQPIISIEAVPNSAGELVTPFHSQKALSTDAA